MHLIEFPYETPQPQQLHRLPTSRHHLMVPDASTTTPLPLVLLSSGGGLLGLDATGCVGLALLDGTLGLADGGGAGDGGGAEVTSVTLGDGVGDALVGPVILSAAVPGSGVVWWQCWVTHLRLDLLPLMVTWLAEAGRCAFPAFLVTRVTPPLSPAAGAMPTAWIAHQYKRSLPSISSRSVSKIVRGVCVRAYLGVGKAGVLETVVSNLVLPFLNIEAVAIGSVSYLAGVQVNQVQRVARELDTATLDNVCVLAAYFHSISLHSHITHSSHPIHPPAIRNPSSQRTAPPLPRIFKGQNIRATSQIKSSLTSGE